MNKLAGILLLLIYVAFSTALLNDNFVSPINVQNVVRWSALYGIIGIGAAFVIITGGIDLSIGSLIGLVGVVMVMMFDAGFSITVMLVTVMVMSMLIGLGHGLLVTKLKLQPFVVTLCGLLIYRGLARRIIEDQTMGFGETYDDSLRLLAIGKPLSVALVLFVSGLIVAAWNAFRLWRPNQNDRRSIRIAIIGFGILIAASSATRFWTSASDAQVIGLARTAGVDVVTKQKLDRETGQKTEVIDLLKMELGRKIGRTIKVTPTPGARGLLPQIGFRFLGWLLVPTFLWALFVAVKPNPREIAVPVAALAASGLWVWVGSEIINDGRFVSHFTGVGEFLAKLLQSENGLSNKWRDMLAIWFVFASVAALFAALTVFVRAARRQGGNASHLPLLVTTGAMVFWLMGHTPICQTMVPTPVFVLATLAIIFGIFLNESIYGRYLLALGRNEEAAKFSGIDTDLMKIIAYMICASIAGIGGILLTLDLNGVQPAQHGNILELYAIAAAVLGGCSLRGGEGSIAGVVIGAAAMRVIYNSIGILGIRPELEYAIVGSVILTSVIVDELVKRYAARRRATLEAEQATADAAA